jgi:FkbM family methyltransferase
MIREKPLFRRRLKTFWRQTLKATLGIKYAGLYGIPRLLLHHLRRNEPIHLVDVGAYDGNFTFGLACYCGLLSGVMVEPLPHKAAALKERFSAPDYRVFDCALADKPGKTELHVNEIEATSSLLQLSRQMHEWDGLQLGKERIIPCAQRTLDSVVAEANVPVIDLLKLDVQGAEHLVLAGGEEALKKCKRIWIECSFKPLYAGSSTFNDIYGLLAARGFQLLELSEAFRSSTGELLQVDALFARR